jgi:hypothetical protein
MRVVTRVVTGAVDHRVALVTIVSGATRIITIDMDGGVPTIFSDVGGARITDGNVPAVSANVSGTRIIAVSMDSRIAQIGHCSTFDEGFRL